MPRRNELKEKLEFMRRTGSVGITKSRPLGNRGSKPGASSGLTAKQRRAANAATLREARALEARLAAAGRPKEGKMLADRLRRRAR